MFERRAPEVWPVRRRMSGKGRVEQKYNWDRHINIVKIDSPCFVRANVVAVHLPLELLNAFSIKCNGSFVHVGCVKPPRPVPSMTVNFWYDVVTFTS